jgi:hypothetical protein
VTVNRLRLNPATGRLAERIPAGADEQFDKPWFTWSWNDGLQIELLSEQDVADWPDVVVAPRPPAPEFAYAVACDGCVGSLATTVHERDRLATTEHADHDTAPYAVRVHHPDRQDGVTVPTFAAGTRVTIYGSTNDEAADLVAATIERSDKRDVDGLPVDGYILAVQGLREMFVPATAVHLATAVTDAVPEQ